MPDSFVFLSVLILNCHVHSTAISFDQKDLKMNAYTGTSRNDIKNLSMSIVLTRKNLINFSDLMFPTDYDITGLQVMVVPSETTNGTLISPSGYRFSFLKNGSSSDALSYAIGSYFENTNNNLEIYLNLSNSVRPSLGTWRLMLENFEEYYNVTVLVYTKILVQARFYSKEKELSTRDKTQKDLIKLGVTGEINHITDIRVLDSNGKILLGNISYKFGNNNSQKDVNKYLDKAPDARYKEVNVKIDNLQNSHPFYALVKGKDIKGNTFQRLTNIFDYKTNNNAYAQLLTVDVALGSELITSPGKRSEVYFEVTNQGTNVLSVYFSCSDQKYILHSLSSYKRVLEARESTVVTLYLITKFGTTYQDEITFSAYSGSQLVQKKVLVDVGSQVLDQAEPELYHKYTSDCTGLIFSKCDQGIWTIEISAKDSMSGLLQVNTEPKGLYFPYAYTSGTKDTVTGYFSDSCCNPDLQISAVDRMNNRKSYYVNAYHALWSPGAIAALVLGIIFFIVLVAIIVYCVVLRVRTKESYDLPTYRGGNI